MRNYKPVSILILSLLVFLSTSVFAASGPASPDDPGWPRVTQKNDKKLTVYQPQVDFWKDYANLHFRCAISVKPGASKQEKFGVAEVDAETVVDQTARVVALIPTKRDLRFPNTSEAEAASLRNTVEELHPFGQAIKISLDRVLACLDPEQQPIQHAVELNLDPPKVYYSRKPAILVIFLGEPQFKPVEPDKNDLMFAVNTNWDVFYDASGQHYYLLDKDNWLSTADAVSGTWAPAGRPLPAGLFSLPQDDNWADVRLQVPGKSVKNPPVVFVSTEPAELILTQGEPSYIPVHGTKIMRISNTDSIVFLNSADRNYYFLTAGRWFRAAGLDGPWSSASTNLPADFSRIPGSDPSAFVKASVPGTIEAKDAVLLASIPSATVVDATKPVAVQITYSGQPQFQAIPETTVQYAVNSPNAVLLVSNAYYCCNQGVWYCGISANGPWTYCTSVPAAIYTIPASCPMHNVTYVTVQNSSPAMVTYTQTAGYSGEYVAATGVLMFGAGMIAGAAIANNNRYYYPPYPVPYSYGCSATYNYAYGGYYKAARASYGPYGGSGAVAAYNPQTGTVFRGAYAYGPAGSASVRQAYNPYTGASATAAHVNTPYGSAGRAAAYNPDTGTAVHAGYKTNDNGSAAAVHTNKGMGAAAVQTNDGAGAAAWNTKNGQGKTVWTQSGNVYAGKDGNVYKKDSSGNWSTHTDNGWETVNKPQPKSKSKQSQPASTGSSTHPSDSQSRTKGQTQQSAKTSANQPSRESTQSLESQAQARQRGNQLNQQTSRGRSFISPSTPAGRTGGGGGGMNRRIR